MIKAEIICDSINDCGDRLTSWVLTYPRFIHSEVMTHRVLSRNASSSRAIPTAKILKTIDENPASPEFWGANEAGMQAHAELSDDDLVYFDRRAMVLDDELVVVDSDSYVEKVCFGRKTAAQMLWQKASKCAIFHATQLAKVGCHKQIVNRVTEPFSHITVLVTGTYFENFFVLRAHEDAQPEFRILAYKMLELYNANKPQHLKDGDWHIPFGDKMDENLTIDDKLKIATARCARLSYLTFDNESSKEKDFELHDRLLKSGHFSPFEHSAQASCSNFVPYSNFGLGWLQYRKTILNENKQDSRVIKHS